MPQRCRYFQYTLCARASCSFFSWANRVYVCSANIHGNADAFLSFCYLDYYTGVEHFAFTFLHLCLVRLPATWLDDLAASASCKYIWSPGAAGLDCAVGRSVYFHRWSQVRSWEKVSDAYRALPFSSMTASLYMDVLPPSLPPSPSLSLYLYIYMYHEACCGSKGGGCSHATATAFLKKSWRPTHFDASLMIRLLHGHACRQEEPEWYSETHPRAYRIMVMIKKGNNRERFIVGKLN